MWDPRRVMPWMMGAGRLLPPVVGWWRLGCFVSIRMVELALSRHAATPSNAAAQEEAE